MTRRPPLTLRDPRLLVMTTALGLLGQNSLCRIDAAIEGRPRQVQKFRSDPLEGWVNKRNPGNARDVHPSEQRTRFKNVDNLKQAMRVRDDLVSSAR